MKIFKNMKFIAILTIILSLLSFAPAQKAYAYSNPATVPLGTVSNFAALAHTTVTSPIAGTILNNGDMGTDADCTGFPSPCLSPGTAIINNGVIQQANGVATTGQTNATAAVTNIGGRSSNETLATQLWWSNLNSGCLHSGRGSYI